MENKQAILQETEAIAPLLASIGKTEPYQIPEGYFGRVPNLVLEKLSISHEVPLTDEVPLTQEVSLTQELPIVPQTPVVSMQFARKWMTYAAAALMAGILIISAFLFSDRHAIKNADNYSKEEMSMTLDQVSDAALSNYLEENTVATNEAIFIEPKVPMLPMSEHMQTLSNEKLDEYLIENSHLIPIGFEESSK